MANKNESGGFKQTKRALREGAFIIYFESLFRDDPIKEIFEITSECGEVSENLRISEESCALACRVAEKAADVDKIIGKYSTKRSIDRIPKINLALLRLALYEATYADDVPVNVAISEAVAIAEKYAQDADVAFINGVLGAYSRSQKKDAAGNG
ncbi:MAG: transcription antitermination factor NusB [Ruminococcus sp.]|nr:transcription antitermination factor NusB [Ruminococcus sp.]